MNDITGLEKTDEQLGLKLINQVRFRGRNTPDGFILEVVRNNNDQIIYSHREIQFDTIEELAQHLPNIIKEFLI